MTGTIHASFPPWFPPPHRGEPAPAQPPPMPVIYEDTDAEQLSLRAYAAIQLRVPDSGIDWLDRMIRKSRELDRKQAR